MAEILPFPTDKLVQKPRSLARKSTPRGPLAPIIIIMPYDFDVLDLAKMHENHPDVTDNNIRVNRPSRQYWQEMQISHQPQTDPDGPGAA